MLLRLFILFFLVLPVFSFGQQESLDQFVAKMKTVNEDSVFIHIDDKLNQLDSINAETAVKIAFLEFKVKMADSLSNRVIKDLAYEEMLAYPAYFAGKDYYNLLKRHGKLQFQLGNQDLAMTTYFTAAQLADSLNNDTLILDINKTIGTAYKKQGNADLSLKYLNDAMRYAEKINDSISIVGNYMTMGNAYKLRRNEDTAYMDTALMYYNKSLALSIEYDYQRGIAGNHNNIGNVYRYFGKMDESLQEFFLALEINQSTGNEQWISYNYHNIGSTYQSLGNHTAALTYYSKSRALKDKLGDRGGVGDTYQVMAISYSELGRYREAYDALTNYVSINKELNNDEKKRMVLELEAKFQNEKKESQINALLAEQSLQDVVIQAQKDDLEHQEQLRAKEKNLIYALGFILLSLIVTVIVFWRNSKQRKKYTEDLKSKNVEIEQVNGEIDQARMRLEEKNEEITDSINYAKRIQAAILPSKKTLDEHLNEAFVLYLPKDIVAGDFYWTERIGDTILFAVADCTGHGVPGAMVSVICHNALNTSIKQMGLTDPGEILDETTRLVLKQFEKSEEEVNDGMDIALCSFNTKTRELRYAGANTPLLIVRGGEIIKFKATRQPVGNHTNRVQFESTSIPVKKGDMVYMSSDGYVDQFGGEKGKKFFNKRLRELLITVANEPINLQKRLLAEHFESWKGDYEQVDDVCILGARVDN